MKNKLNQLILKVDQLMETQQLILKRLDQSTHLTKEPIKTDIKSNKAALRERENEEMMLILKNRYILKNKFNLAACPQNNRILAYLRTKDPKVFDGLKRKS